MLFDVLRCSLIFCDVFLFPVFSYTIDHIDGMSSNKENVLILDCYIIKASYALSKLIYDFWNASVSHIQDLYFSIT